ncbi:MAG: trypsin-like peptidase domain-containing protein [Chloroflexota bacterium]|nr:trypsin-like peptidase domain-containing protein [Chloroflexota bacterium]
MKRRGSFVMVAVVSALLGGASVIAVNHARHSSNPTASNLPAADARSSVLQPANGETLIAASSVAANDFSALYAAVRPSIVEITTVGQSGRRFSQQTTGQGSGVVLDTDGHILTNYHVVRGAQTVTITFADKSTASADVVGTDPTDDLAVVKTDANQSELHPATLGDSGGLKVGNFVAAVGNPFGLEGSFTTGVVSGLGRTLAGGRGQADQQGLVQTDAAVNEGSSGGGLFDAQGEVVGINSALENPDASTFAGVAYAVPINTAKQHMQQLLGN